MFEGKEKKIKREQERDKHIHIYIFRIKNKIKSQQRLYLEAGPNQCQQGKRKKKQQISWD